jgi:pSer/pThr/pTyr-binding forkhead associated (FHA) protein
MLDLRQGDLQVTFHLLDSAQGHRVQSWRFKDKSTITIGRSEDCDVVIADAHVSRQHATVSWRDGRWAMISTGRHGTLINDGIVAETELQSGTVLRLGSNGPMLQFEAGVRESQPTETIARIDPDVIAMLEIDRDRQQKEVDSIASNMLFLELQDRARRTRFESLE